jgi:hypothetical protein
MKTHKGTFGVEEVNKMPIAEAVAALDEADRKQFENVDWKKVPYEYKEFETLDESGYSQKDILELVNTAEKGKAKSKEYQRITKPFRPDTSTPEYKREQFIKFLVSQGVPAELAEQQVGAMLAAAK